MQVIDEKTVVIETSEELKQVLSEDNNYVYIYFGDDITLSGGFTINKNKEKVIIDGTYQNIKHTYTNNLSEASDVINVSTTNKKIILKNMNIISSHTYSVIYVPPHPNYSNLKVEYNNVKFTGIQLSSNYYGITSIIDSVIEVKDTNNVSAQRVCDCNRTIIGGNTSITSSATTSTVFLINDVISSYLKIMPNSIVSINTDKELMNGTNKLDLTVGHGAEFNLTTGNGFAITTTHGARNVLVEEMAKFTFIEKSHQRVPMWNIFGDFNVKEGASVYILNTYSTTPVDNYNIYFKGTNQKFILDNPKYINIYTKNANVFYTINPVKFTFRFSRINMWIDAKDYTSACNLDDMPILYWYKEHYPAEVIGIFTKDTTVVNSHNFSADELSQLPDISNFSFQGRKILTIGIVKSNIHQINNISNVLSGHTIENASVLLEYEDKKVKAEADESGLFEMNLDDVIEDGTSIKITSCLNGCYYVKKITSPFNGELTILKVTENIPFSMKPISQKPLLLPKENNTIITVVDSRKNKTNWRVYINFINPMIGKNGKVLMESLLFKKFNNEIINLTTSKKIVYEATATSGDVEVSKVTFSKDKGLLLSPSKNLLEDDDYSNMVIWSIEE